MGRQHLRAKRRLRLWAPVAAVALAVIAVAPAPAAPGLPEIAATVSPAELSIGAATVVSGRLGVAGQGSAGTPLQLQSEAYPFHGFLTVARAVTAADGSFSFAPLRPDRNTRVRVLVEGQPAASSPELAVTVDPKVTLAARSLGLGRTRLSVRMRHAPLGGLVSVSAAWYLQARGSRVFRLAAVTPTRELSPGLLVASTIVDPPSKRFSYRVCVNPPWEHAMGAPATHGACPSGDFVLPASHGA